MTGTITKIHPPRESYSGDTVFVRVEFELEDGKWAKSDICPAYRNYKNWQKYLFVGNKLKGLDMKDEKTVDADSKIELDN